MTAAQLAHVERRLGGCAAIRGTDLHQELAEHYAYAGSYPSFQRQLRLLRPAVVREPEIRFETDPGHQAQTDWGHMGVWPVDGEPRELFGLVTPRIQPPACSALRVGPNQDHDVDLPGADHRRPRRGDQPRAQ